MADNGGIHRAPTAKGLLIGSNDLSIAATALGHGTGVVTNNVDEFSRVPDLTVVPC
jgi:predicted nucleic acid-binding protein